MAPTDAGSPGLPILCFHSDGFPERGWNSRVTESTFSPPFFTLAQNGNRQVSYNGHHLQQGTAAGHHINDTLLGWTDYWVITPYHPCMLWVYVIIAESKETNHSTTLEWLVSGQHFNSFILIDPIGWGPKMSFKLILDPEKSADFTKGCPHRLKVSTDTITKVGYSHGTSRWRSMSRRYSTAIYVHLLYLLRLCDWPALDWGPVYYSKFATIWINLA